MHTIILFIYAFLLDFYLINKLIMTDVPNISPVFRQLLSLNTKLSILSTVIFSFYLSNCISPKLIRKFFIGILTYISITYFVLVTRNLNNKDFNPLDFIKNDFVPVKGLLVINIIIVFALIIKWLILKYDKKQSVETLFSGFNNNKLILALMLGFVVFTQADFTVFFHQSIPDLTNASNLSVYITKISRVTLILLLVSTFINIVFFKAFSDLKHLKSSLSLSFASSFIIAIILNYTIQYSVRNDSDLLGRYIFPGPTSYQILILILFSLLVYLITNRYLSSTLFILTIGFALSIANILKEKMRSEPILVTDFLWLKQLTTVLSFIDRSVVFYVFIAIFTPIVIYFIIKKFIKITPIIDSLLLRVTLLVGIISIFFAIYKTFENEKDSKIASDIPILSEVNNWYDIEWMGPNVNARYKSLLFVWTKQLTKDVMQKPEGYSKKEIQKIVEKYYEEALNINQTRPNNIEDQTVIYILSESFSDPARIKNIQMSQEDIIPNINQIKTETTSGMMKSDGFGGGTANMEFQTLTGLPYYNYSQSVSTLYTEVVPKMRKFPSISDFYAQKHRVVMHPSGAQNYNRKSIYEDLGFEHLIFSVDSEEKFVKPKFKGVSISDETVYDNILLKMRRTNSNQFFSIITMQNHVPWSIGAPQSVTGQVPTMNEEQNGQLTEYMRLLSYTDSYTKAFLEQLKQIDKHVTVVFYGDHLPGFYPDSVFKGDESIKFKTDYFIWSNYQSKKLDYPLVNSSDFTAELLSHTDSKVTPYYALLTKILDEASVEKEKLDRNQKIISEELKMIQYDITLGKNYSTKLKFFEKIE